MPQPYYYQVAPRYTSGSPAMVDQTLAERVAKEEARAYRDGQDCGFGTVTKVGLDGIVERLQEYKGGWRVLDLITGRSSFRKRVSASKIRPKDVVLDLGPGNLNPLDPHVLQSTLTPLQRAVVRRVVCRGMFVDVSHDRDNEPQRLDLNYYILYDKNAQVLIEPWDAPENREQS